MQYRSSTPSFPRANPSIRVLLISKRRARCHNINPVCPRTTTACVKSFVFIFIFIFLHFFFITFPGGREINIFRYNAIQVWSPNRQIQHGWRKIPLLNLCVGFLNPKGKQIIIRRDYSAGKRILCRPEHRAFIKKMSPGLQGTLEKIISGDQCCLLF